MTGSDNPGGNNMMRRKLVLSGLWLALVAALALAAGLIWHLWGPDQPGTADFGQGDYHLATHDGQPFTAASLKGAPSIVFFGFTHCPDVCPTTMGDIATWQEELGEEAEDLRIFFVSVDPERDTPEILADYIGWLPNAQGVSGSVDETRKAMQSFRVFARQVPDEAGGYTVDHSSSALLFSADGRFVTTIPYQASDALERLRRVLG